MEDFWAGALWALRIWLYLIISLIMVPAMFGFSLGISETYMSILVKTLEVLFFILFCFSQMCLANILIYTTGPEMVISISCLSFSTVGHSENTESKHRRTNTQSLII